MRIEVTPIKWLKIRGGLMYTHSDKRSPQFRLATAEKQANEYWYNFYRYPETYPYGYIDGQPLKNIRTELEQAHMNHKISDMSRFQVGTTLTFLKGWTADFDYTYMSTNGHNKRAATPISGINLWSDPTLTKWESSFFPAENWLRLDSSWSKRQVAKAYSTYDVKLGKHAIKLMVGMDAEYAKSESQYSRRYGLYDPTKPEFPLTDPANMDTNGSASHWSTLGFFGRVNYNLMDRYLFEFNIRRDGASKFSKNCRWDTFPSFSIGWLLSEEKWMERFKEITKMSFTKLRLSWGRIGNNNVGSHSYLSNIGNGRSDWWIGSTNPLSFGTPTVAATTLTWEPVETVDLGINAKFLIILLISNSIGSNVLHAIWQLLGKRFHCHWEQVHLPVTLVRCLP